MAINHFSPLRILLAVDDSLYSTAAVNLVARITWPAGTIVHILALVPDRLPLMEGSPEARSQVDERLEVIRWRDWAAATAITNEAAAQLRAHNVAVETDIGQGPPTAAILKSADEVPADLIVVGARGFNSSGEAPIEFDQPLSPAVHKLVHYANHSVLVARPSRQIRPMNTVVAVDDSAKAWRAVKFLSSLSLFEWARVCVVNVDEKKLAGQAEAGDAGYQMPSMHQPLYAEVTAGCTGRVIDHLHGCGVQAGPISRAGEPAEEILATAQEQQADLIVIGIHAQPNPNLWQGVAQKIVKCAPCSVLAIRREQKEISTGSQDPTKDETDQDRQRFAVSLAV